MSINRSEQFLYFQNKSKHYDNINKVKATVDDKLSKSLRNTIDHSSSRNKDKDKDKSKDKSQDKSQGQGNRLMPYLQRYQLNIENEKMINRLVSIVGSKRKEIQINGDYSRYHRSQRKFRLKNPYREGVIRQIQLENQEIVSKLANVKPMVGTSSQWEDQYKSKLSHRRNLSRFAQSQKSKGSLIINTQKFIPEHYKKMLENGESLDCSQKMGGITIIPKQKLISFPKIIKKQKSNSVLVASKSKQNLDI